MINKTMKAKLTQTLSVIIITLAYQIAVTTAFAQSPQGFSYQAVVRDAGNKLLTNKNVGMQISILQGTATGTAVYTETQTATTNNNGLVTVIIGNGTVISGTFASINWSKGLYFIEVETDPTGGTTYTITNTNQLLSVPYALYASSSGSVFPLADSAVLLKGNQTVTGTKTFNDDLVVSGITVGQGKGSVNSNTVIGYQAGNTNSTGNYNTASGYQVLFANTTGNRNVANGYQALYNNTTGIHNTAIGHCSLNKNTTGNNNTDLGTYSQNNNNTGSYNTAIGVSSLYINESGYGNVAVGFDAGYSNSGNNNIFIGDSAGINETGSNKLYIASSGTNSPLIYGDFNTGVLTVNGNLTVTGSVTAPNNSNHYIGELFGGGIVFYVYDNGHHGLIADTVDLSSNAPWTCSSFQSTYTYAFKNGVNGGIANTVKIVTQAGEGPLPPYAAQLCDKYNGGNFSDWYLPSYYELNLMYSNIGQGASSPYTNIGAFANNFYWSSTEYNGNTACLENFSNGANGVPSKSTDAYVRAIRAF